MQTRIICIYKLHYHRYLVVRVGAQVINVILEYDDVEQLMATGLPVADDITLQQYINADTDLWYKIEAEMQEQYWKEHQDELNALKEEHDEPFIVHCYLCGANYESTDEHYCPAEDDDESFDEQYDGEHELDDQEIMDDLEADHWIGRHKSGEFDDLPF